MSAPQGPPEQPATDRSDRMLVIGAGPVGLSVAKHFAEAGIAYDEVDASDDVGGNWHHGVYATAHIISSAKTTEFADHPMPEDYPDFPSRAQMCAYYREYAATYGLRDHLELHTKVLGIVPEPDDLWRVHLAQTDPATGEVTTSERIYKGVALCNGHHWDRRWPSYPGEFSGQMIHSKDYRDPDQLKGKRVLVIGGGNSACDVATEAARVGAHAVISQRRGYWITPKTVFGRPSVEMMNPWMPIWLQRLCVRIVLAIVVGDYRRYGLQKPDHKIFETHPTVSTEILFYLKQGTLTAKPDIEQFDGSTVHFTDGTSDEFDLVVCATGFHLSFPFLPPGVIDVKGPVAQVYGGAMSPKFKHVYAVGTQQVRYGLGPVVTPLSEYVAAMVKLQDELERPLGELLRSIGDKPPPTHLVDPHQSIRRMRFAQRWLPGTLRRADRKMSKKLGSYRHPDVEVPKLLAADASVN